MELFNTYKAYYRKEKQYDVSCYFDNESREIDRRNKIARKEGVLKLKKLHRTAKYREL